MGYGGQDAFTQDLLGHLGNVRQLYDSLFSEADTLAEPGNLVFTGTDPDPGTTTTLTGLGFRNPQRVFEIVRAWHSGSIRATRSARAREILTELVPSLIKSLAGAREPDRVLVDFDRFLARLPLGVPVFAMFQTNPQLIDLVAEVLSNSPFLAEHMTHHPGVLEGILAGGAALDGRVRADLGSALRISQTYQDVLDIVRRWANDARFEVGLGLLQGRRTPREAGADLSEIADATVEALLTATLEEFRERHGAFPDSSFAILAYGKWGSGDLTLGSDLDMVAVYDAPLKVTHSDGPETFMGLDLFQSPDATPANGDYGPDGRRAALRDRSASPSFRKGRASRHPYRRVRVLPEGGCLDLGAHGAGPLPRCRRTAGTGGAAGCHTHGSPGAAAQRPARSRPRHAGRRWRQGARPASPSTSSTARAA